MSTLLLEIFSEEIPARMQEEAARHLSAALAASLEAAGLKAADAKTFVTPRRVAVMLEGLPDIQPDVTVEKKGPKVSAPQGAIDGFLKSSGLSLDKLEKRMLGKDETYFAVIHQKGRPVADILKPAIEKILADFPWPKSMRWGSGETRWVRPLHSILCLLGEKIVPVEFAGVSADNVTYGHRFMAPSAITITDPAQYAAKLKDAKVLADAMERKAEILRQAQEAAGKNGLTLKPDEGLLREVTGLVEWPVALVGIIDARFMDLPPEVLTSEMRAHQKYFALIDKAGTLAPKFLIVSNMETEDGGKAVVAGNERVLRARLSDGRFFFDQDRKKSLGEWAKGLAGVTFHAKIGTVAEKVERIKKFAVALSDYVPGADKKLVEQAACLCKADLTTGMVGEFPDLQGVMGRYYALHQKEDASVADAIRDHYLPLGPDSSVPAKPVSVCVALADKLDTLKEMFRVQEQPTGSRDPYALRRAALGVIRIILENNIRLPLSRVIPTEAGIQTLPFFFFDRLKVQLKDQGIRHDIISAVTSNGDDDLVRIVERAQALKAFLATENGANLLAAYKRATNIVGIEEKKDNITYNAGHLNPAILEQDEEKGLSMGLGITISALEEHLNDEQYIDAMNELASLRQYIDPFFDKVLVNCDNKTLRTERLRLLARIRTTFDMVADFSKIEG